MTAYDPENIFAKILRGEFSSHKVYEDADLIAVMDVFPQSPGHVLVIPKAASRNLLDADPAVLAKVMPTVQKIARAAKTAMLADGIRLAQFSEAPAGQSVFHLHFHVIPMYEGAKLSHGHGHGRAEDAALAAQAKKIAAALA